MLYHLLFPLAPQLGVLNVTRYITYRTAVASISALVISLVLGPWLIRRLRDFQIGQVTDVLTAKLTKRGLDIRFLDFTAKIEKIGGDKVKRAVKVKNGIDTESAKKIQGLVKQSKMKVQAAIQGDVVRISGGKRDDLQTAIAMLRREVTDLPLTFTNFRD